MRFRVLSILAIVAALTACANHPGDPYSGTLEAPSAAVGSTTGGRIAQVFVSEGDPVRTGQVLVRFESTQQQGDLAAATALVAQQRAQYEIARSGQPYQASVSADQVRQARARLHDALATARNARTNSSRTQSLYATGDLSAAQRDAALAQSHSATAEVAAARAALSAAQTQSTNVTKITLPQTAASALAAYRAAQGTLVQARQRFSETVVLSPANGVVTAMDLHPGDLIAPGASVATIEERGNPFVRIYVPQSSLGKFSIGLKLAVHSDALPGETFTGIVENIDARAQFTPLNVQTESDREGLSFGVKVRISDPKQRLHAGTTVGVSSP